jgi:hypothetical protein
MSLAHLFDQPVVNPRPTRVVRAPLDVEPAIARKQKIPLVYVPVIALHTPAEPPKRKAMTPEERQAKKREYGRAYRERQAAMGRKKKRKPYSEFTEAEKAVRRERQLVYYYANKTAIAERERLRYQSMTPEQREAYAAACREWRNANKDRVNAANRARRQAKKRKEAAGA